MPKATIEPTSMTSSSFPDLSAQTMNKIPPVDWLFEGIKTTCFTDVYWWLIHVIVVHNSDT
jgi:hypothetical protein